MVETLRGQEREVNDAGSDAPVLRIRGVSKRFGSVTALDDVSLDALPGEFVCIVGPSGCGKTTLLRSVAGLESPSDGTIELRGEDVTQWPPPRRRCGVVFQSYALFPNLTAERNVAYGLRGRARAEQRATAQQWLAWVGLENEAKRYPAQLSGGQQQRVALARALAPEPAILLLDEPLSALDARVRQHLRTEIRGMQQRLGITTIMVTHDQLEALTMADRVVVMNEGRILQAGRPEEVYRQPAAPFVADFLGSTNFLTLDARDNAHHWGASFSVPLPNAPKPVRAAIRPEHIAIVSASEPTSLAATVESVEFRGSIYWLRACVDDDSVPEAERDLQIETTPDRFPENGLRAGDSVRLRISTEHLVVFPEAS